MTTTTAQLSTEHSELTQLLHFLSAETEFCVALKNVVKVQPIVYLRYVPGGPRFLRGLMAIDADDSVLVIDLAERLALDNQRPYTIDTPILLCTANDQQVGVIVDEVLGVSDISEEDLQMSPQFKDAGVTSFRTSINTERGLSLLLDIGQVFNVDLAVVSAEPADDPRHNG